MIVLALRTDKPQAEIYLFKAGRKIAGHKWQAHLKLAETLNAEIEKILNKSSISYDQLEGIAIFKGPGSFTGLRIGMSVANSLAYAQGIPIVARGTDQWLKVAVTDLLDGQNDKTALPEYGAPARVTKPRK